MPRNKPGRRSGAAARASDGLVEESAMRSTMQDFPLTTTSILRRGRDLFGSSQLVSFEGDSSRRADFSAVSERAERLASALGRLGIREGDRVGTLSWNNQEHQEAYLAVPSMGAVLHTLNLRLAPEQLAFVINQPAARARIVSGPPDTH